VGFFFSLGHSSVVFALTVLLSLGLRALGGEVRDGHSSLHHWTGLVGASVSGAFLYLIAALNIVVLVSILRVFARLRRGQFDPDELEAQLDNRGFLNRYFGGVTRRIDAAWMMYPVGVLFGLGFDTATEVALLVLSGSAVASGLPFWAVLCLPFLFAAGMSLLDTIDGSFMNFAYGWAFSKPVRKVYYNLVITALSVAAAVLIGTIELVQVLADQLNLTGGFWSWDQSFNINHAGFAIVGLFVVTWVAALAVWRLGRVEQRWDDAMLRATEQP
jgi:high-affinity nickel-transport protein